MAKPETIVRLLLRGMPRGSRVDGRIKHAIAWFGLGTDVGRRKAIGAMMAHIAAEWQFAACWAGSEAARTAAKLRPVWESELGVEVWKQGANMALRADGSGPALLPIRPIAEALGRRASAIFEAPAAWLDEARAAIEEHGAALGEWLDPCEEQARETIAAFELRYERRNGADTLARLAAHAPEGASLEEVAGAAAGALIVRALGFLVAGGDAAAREALVELEARQAARRVRVEWRGDAALVAGRPAMTTLADVCGAAGMPPRRLRGAVTSLVARCRGDAGVALRELEGRLAAALIARSAAEGADGRR